MQEVVLDLGILEVRNIIIKKLNETFNMTLNMLSQSLGYTFVFSVLLQHLVGSS